MFPARTHREERRILHGTRGPSPGPHVARAPHPSPGCTKGAPLAERALRVTPRNAYLAFALNVLMKAIASSICAGVSCFVLPHATMPDLSLPLVMQSRR